MMMMMNKQASYECSNVRRVAEREREREDVMYYNVLLLRAIEAEEEAVFVSGGGGVLPSSRI